MTDVPNDACAATPAADLEGYIMNPNLPKNEAEHWAAREIANLRADLDRLAGPVCGNPACGGARAAEHSIGRREGGDFGYYLTSASVLFQHPPAPLIEAWLRERGE